MALGVLWAVGWVIVWWRRRGHNLPEQSSSPTPKPDQPAPPPPKVKPPEPERLEPMNDSEGPVGELVLYRSEVPSLKEDLFGLLEEGRGLQARLTRSSLDVVIERLVEHIEDWIGRVDHRLERAGQTALADDFRKDPPRTMADVAGSLIAGSVLAMQTRKKLDQKVDKLREIVRGLPSDTPSDRPKAIQSDPPPPRSEIANDVLDELARAELRVSRARETGLFPCEFEIPTVAWTKHRLRLDTELPKVTRQELGYCYAALVELRDTAPAGREVRDDDRLNEVADAIGAAQRAVQQAI